jgi:hypothetical protein
MGVECVAQGQRRRQASAYTEKGTKEMPEGRAKENDEQRWAGVGGVVQAR